MSTDQLSTLSTYSACDISDILLQLGVECGGYLADLMPMIGGAEGGSVVCGPAYTVSLVAKEDTEQPRLEGHWADSIPPDSIVFVSSPSSHLPNAVWGGLMSARARKLGAKAAVVDGRVRDLNELRSVGLPVLARGVSATSAQSSTRPSAINIPVTLNPSPSAQYVSQPIIHPGDILFLDAQHGCVCIPKEMVEVVLQRLPAWVGGEEEVRKAVADGMGLQEALRRYRIK